MQNEKEQQEEVVVTTPEQRSSPRLNWRLSWNTTDMFQTGGLSTYRGGGGLHAE